MNRYCYRVMLAEFMPFEGVDLGLPALMFLRAAQQALLGVCQQLLRICMYLLWTFESHRST